MKLINWSAWNSTFQSVFLTDKWVQYLAPKPTILWDEGSWVMTAPRWNRPEDDEDADTLRVSEIFSLLADRDRRIALRFLSQNRTRPVAVQELIEEIQAARPPENPADASKIELELHHSHLPTLDDSGVIQYDEEAKTVQYRGGPILEAALRVGEGADADR